MKQPEIGKRVTQLRLQKGMTQEVLAELCEVSTRTIQRIESGDVDPRTYTLNTLGNVLDFDFNGEDRGNDIFWIALMHLSSTLCILIIPLLIWSYKKKTSFKIDEQGKTVLNFQITMTILLLGTTLLYTLLLPTAIILLEKNQPGWDAFFGVLSIVLLIPLMAIGFICFIQGIKNSLYVLNDKSCKYTPSIAFLK